jgi:hypothetical protein
VGSLLCIKKLESIASMLKKILFILTHTFILSGYAQKKILAGAGITYCNYIDRPGVNLNLTYQLTERIHFGPDFSAILTRKTKEDDAILKRKEVEYNFNGQYLFKIHKAVEIYPLVGINFSKLTVHNEGMFPQKRWIAAMNYGGGMEAEFQGFKLFCESKYVSQLSKVDFTIGILCEL